MPSGPSADREHHVEHGHVERLVVARRRQQAAGAVVALQRLEARHLRVVEERALAEDHPAALGLRIEQVALGADRRADRGHELLADRVERRVGDLREQLLEVVGQRPRAAAEHGEGRVVAHRADRLLALERHRRHQDLEVLLRVAERVLQRAQRLAGVRRRRLGRLQRLERHQVLADPLLVRLLGRDPVLDLLVGDDPALGEIDEEHLAGLQAALLDHLVRRHVEHADLGREDDVVVGGHPVAGRAQAVAIEHGADLHAVGEGHARRAVPRLDEAGVVGVERLLLLAHRVVVLPRLGHQHHHRVRQRAARPARAVRARCRGRPNRSGPRGRSAAPSRGRRRTAARRASPRGRASS